MISKLSRMDRHSDGIMVDRIYLEKTSHCVKKELWNSLTFLHKAPYPFDIPSVEFSEQAQNSIVCERRWRSDVKRKLRLSNLLLSKIRPLGKFHDWKLALKVKRLVIHWQL